MLHRPLGRWLGRNTGVLNFKDFRFIQITKIFKFKLIQISRNHRTKVRCKK